MSLARMAGGASLGVALLILGFPGILYSIGLLRVHGRPTPASTADFPSVDIAVNWQRCGERLPLEVEPLNPWGVAGRLLWGTHRQKNAGETAAWQVARAHNLAHPVGTMGWWHLSGSALTIWITRHWSAEEIGATLARDNLCK